jgi:uncharacterized membrane protein
MHDETEEEDDDEGFVVSSRFLAFLILGIALVLVGIAVLVVVSLLSSSSSGSVGVVIFIGPFPIVFGAGPNALWLILIGIILAALSVAFFFVMNRRIGRA